MNNCVTVVGGAVWVCMTVAGDKRVCMIGLHWELICLVAVGCVCIYTTAMSGVWLCMRLVDDVCICVIVVVGV